MKEPVYEKNEFEVLKVRYVEQAAHIRDLNMFDVKIFGGFMTIQLALASWFAIHPVSIIWLKIGILVIDLALLFVCIKIIHGSRDRRAEIVQTIININEAFGLYQKGVYLVDRAINPPPKQRSKSWYDIGCVVGALGVAWILIVPFP